MEQIRHQHSSSFNITTQQIQKYLDENAKLIVAIMENQNLGRLTECTMLQAQLQQNLLYLAKIADAQQPGATMPSQSQSESQTQFQMFPQSTIQQEHNMQPLQIAMPQHPTHFNPQLSFQISNQKQHQFSPHHQQQYFAQELMHMRPPNINR